MLGEVSPVAYKWASAGAQDEAPIARLLANRSATTRNARGFLQIVQWAPVSSNAAPPGSSTQQLSQATSPSLRVKIAVDVMGNGAARRSESNPSA